MSQWHLHSLCICIVSIFFLKPTNLICINMSTHRLHRQWTDANKSPIKLSPVIFSNPKRYKKNWSLTGGGFFRRLKTLVSPRLREAMVGWGPKDASSSLCQAMLSFPSRYRLHSKELKVWESSFSIFWRKFRRMGCHYGRKMGNVWMCTKVDTMKTKEIFARNVLNLFPQSQSQCYNIEISLFIK